MTTKNANYWRDKYRELLLEREQARKQDTGDYQRAIALLAEQLIGQDQVLDETVAVVRKQAGRGEWGKPGQLALLETQLKDFGQRQKQLHQRRTQALAAAAKALAIPHLANGRALAAKIEKLVKKPKQNSDWVRALELLAELQPAGEAPPQPGLLSRLFGTNPSQADAVDNAVADQSQPVECESDEPPASDPAPGQGPKLAADEPTVDDPSAEEQTVHAARQSLSGHWIAARDVVRHEPPFSKISDRISTVLGDLLRQIEPPWPDVAEKAVAARMRIDSGLNWYELVPTLEDIRDLVMALLVNAKSDYQAYLLALLEKLNGVLALTGELVVDLETDESAFVEKLQANVGSLSQALQSMNDVAELKTLVQNKVDLLSQLLAERAQPDNRLLEKVARLQDQVKQLQTDAETREQTLKQEYAKARTDALTKLPNREHYNERVHQEVERYKRYSRPLAMAVCDIDHFKRFNDDYSHQAGDRVLKVIGQAISKKLRETDFIARYGGEEFVILMPETSAEDCQLKMDRIREAVAKTAFKFKEQTLNITFSCGIAEIEDKDNPSTLFERADKALYAAKDAGRNRCVTA